MSGAGPIGDATAGKRGALRVAVEDGGAGLADRLRASLGWDVGDGGTRFRLDPPPADPAG